MKLRVIAYSQAEYWSSSTSKGYIVTRKGYSIAKDDDIAGTQSAEKENIEKEEKEAEEYRILEKQSLFWGKKAIRKNKVCFGEGRKRSRPGDGIYVTSLLTAVPLV